MTYWKFGERYAYITSRGKRGIVDKLSQVPQSAKGASSTSSTKKKSTSPKKTRSGKKTAKKKTTRRGGTRLPGGIGFKAAIFGAAGLVLAPRLIPIQSPGASKLAAGMAMRALKIGGGGPLAAVGIMELIAQYAAPLVLGGGLGSSGGGTDF